MRESAALPWARSRTSGETFRAAREMAWAAVCWGVSSKLQKRTSATKRLIHFTVGQPFFMTPRFLDDLRTSSTGMADSEAASGTFLEGRTDLTLIQARRQHRNSGAKDLSLKKAKRACREGAIRSRESLSWRPVFQSFHWPSNFFRRALTSWTTCHHPLPLTKRHRQPGFRRQPTRHPQSVFHHRLVFHRSG